MRLLAILSPLVIFSILAGSILLAYALTHEATPKVTITIPEGATVADINSLLKEKGVLEEDLPESLEGYLFPDTYEFFVPSSPDAVKAKFEENFGRKVKAGLSASTGEAELHKIITAASLIEAEVPDPVERRVVSDIMQKRLKAGIPLQMDAAPDTYRTTGLPHAPIVNPGLDAVQAVLAPTPSPYWYYLSDPKTQKTVFSKTLDEHNANIVKYLNK